MNVLSNRQILQSFTDGKLASNLDTYIEALLVISGWYAQSRGQHICQIEIDLVKALEAIRTLFGDARTTSNHYLLKHGNDFTPSYPYQYGERYTCRLNVGHYVTYTFETCTWLARKHKIDRYIVVRLVDHIPCLFSHHYLVQALRHLSQVNIHGPELATCTPVQMVRFVRAVTVCQAMVDSNLEHPAYWVKLDKPEVTVVNSYREGTPT